ncbi:hypothetical protein [Brevundimonas sp.]|uniref:hypothetical protein n=1 Tax=Brevundimonas sp. TaxID=1871086 RepID=UPI0037BFCE06
MRRALILSTVLIAACAASGAAMAQATASPQSASGLRYLSWPGKPPVAAASSRQTAPQPTRVVAVANTPVSPIPLARLDAPAPAPAPASAPPRSPTPAPRRGLTPASDWISPTPTPTLPQAYAAPQDAPAQAAPIPTAAQTQTPRPMPAEAAAVEAQAQAQADVPPAEPAFDPMAPRRDAPIFRLQRQASVGAAAEAAAQDAAEPSASKTRAEAKAEPRSAEPPAMVQAALAPVQGPRFYSVHRQAGRQPDPIGAVQPIYLDALPVEMTQTPSSADLAQPDGPPALLRSSDGSVRAMPQTQADDLP